MRLIEFISALSYLETLARISWASPALIVVYLPTFLDLYSASH